ncbi:MAG: DUF839 domain-containing protein [Acidocella sp.]|nr:DUF839 domain-containing protein [Acidocella sp.]
MPARVVPVRAPVAWAAARAILAVPAMAAASEQIITRRLSRRALLGGISLTAICTTAAHAQSALGIGTESAVSVGTIPAPLPPMTSPELASQIPRLDDKTGAGFTRFVIARWGDALLPGAPAFAPAELTQRQASTQIPYDCVIAGLSLPQAAQDGTQRLVLTLANPTAPARMLFPSGSDKPAIAGAMQGASVLNLQYNAGRWDMVAGGYQARRINDGTLCQISGPVAASLGGTVQGVLAPQGGCATPWGSVLLAEGHAAPWLSRLETVGFGFNDPADAPRFAWITEFDPLHVSDFPAKRTALGRFARAGVAATQTSDGRPVIFMSQEDPGGFLFRFIAANAATDGTALDSGVLSVAQTGADGVSWLDLGSDIPTLAGAIGAAAAAGATAFDNPAGLAISQGNGAIYLACSGNQARTEPDALNPRAGDPHGHIICLTPPGGDVTARHFPARLVLAAGNPAFDHGTQYANGSSAWLTQPRSVALDPDGNLWIGTNQKGVPSATADGLFIMQTGGPSPGLVSLGYLAPIGAAMGGVAFHAATRTAFAAVRHPGATPQASFNAPATRWPTLRPDMPPQTTIIGLVRA